MLKLLPLLQAHMDVGLSRKQIVNWNGEHCFKSLMYRAIVTAPGHKHEKKIITGNTKVHL